MQFLKTFNPNINWITHTISFPSSLPISSRLETEPITGITHSLTLLHSSTSPSKTIPNLQTVYENQISTSPTFSPSILHSLAPIQVKSKKDESKSDQNELKDELTEKEYEKLEKDNEKLNKELFESFDVTQSKIVGKSELGVFNKKPINKKTRLMPYTGRTLTVGIDSFPEDETYLMRTRKKTVYIDASDPNISSICRYVNTLPTGDNRINCTYQVGKNGTVYLWSNRYIPPGTELFATYGRRKKYDIPPSSLSTSASSDSESKSPSPTPSFPSTSSSSSSTPSLPPTTPSSSSSSSSSKLSPSTSPPRRRIPSFLPQSVFPLERAKQKCMPFIRESEKRKIDEKYEQFEEQLKKHKSNNGIELNNTNTHSSHPTRTPKHKIRSHSVLSPILLSKPSTSSTPFPSSDTTRPTPAPIELCHLSAKDLKRARQEDDGIFLILVNTSNINQIDNNSNENNNNNKIEINITEVNTPSTPKLTPVEIEVEKYKNEILKHYSDCFPDSLPPGLPPHRNIEHEIKLKPNSEPIYKPHHKMTPLDNDELKIHLTELLEQKFISPSSSPYGAPILFVKKKGETRRRMCIDYRDINNQTIKNRYPLPRITELIERLQGAKFFTKLDLRQGYYQIRVKPEDRYKTAFVTRYGQYEFSVMPFGLCNAPATFQHFINTVLSTLTDECAISYLDDIVIYSKTLEEHVKHVQLVLDKLRENQLFCKLQKCEFFKPSIHFLGFIVSSDGLQVDPAKIEAIKTWQIPTTLTECRAFLGFIGFYRKFVKNHSTVVAPITDLTKTKTGLKFKWTDAATKAFNEIKQLLTTAPLLVIPDPTKPYVLQTDCSGFAMGAVLQQDQGKGLQPISYFSRKLDEHQINYPTHQKEMLAIICALKEYEYLLKGSPFQIIVNTDHRSLQHINTQQKLTGRQARWVEYLSEYGDIKIQYLAGKQMVLADALSRRPHDSDNIPQLPSPIVPIDITSSSSSTGLHPIAELLVLSSSTIRSSLHKEIIKSYQSDPITKSLLLSPSPLITVKDGLLYKKGKIIIPNDKTLIEKIISSFHDNPLSAHNGITKTTSIIQRNYIFPNLNKLVKEYVKTCLVCQTCKSESKKPLGQLSSLPIPESRLETYSLDFIGPLPPSGPHKYNSILVVVEKLTRLATFIPTHTNISAADTASLFFTHIVCRFGFPKVLISDRDSKFTSTFWQTLWKLTKTKFNMSSSFHPQTDGATEIINKVLKQMIRAYTDEKQTNWAEHLPYFEFAYNNSINSTTKYTPFFLLYGQHPHLPNIITTSPLPPLIGNANVETLLSDLQNTIQQVKINISKAQQSQTKYYNQHHQPHVFKLNEKVLLDSSNISVDKLGSAKLNDKFIGPYKIIKVNSDHSYTLQLPPHFRIHPTFHVSKLRPYHSSSTFAREQDDRPEPIITPSKELMYEVESIVDSRTVKINNKNQKQVLVKWKHYPSSENTWEPLDKISKQIPEMIRAFQQSQSQ